MARLQEEERFRVKNSPRLMETPTKKKKKEYDVDVDGMETIVKPKDVLCGRGGATNTHEGNRRYRRIVADHQLEYLHAKKSDKIWIARKIVDMIRQDGGRFLKRSNTSCQWVDVGNTKATEKTSQALREGLDVRKYKESTLEGRKSPPPPSTRRRRRRQQQQRQQQEHQQQQNHQKQQPPSQVEQEELSASSMSPSADTSEAFTTLPADSSYNLSQDSEPSVVSFMPPPSTPEWITADASSITSPLHYGGLLLQEDLPDLEEEEASSILLPPFLFPETGLLDSIDTIVEV